VYFGGPSETIPRSLLVCRILNTCSPSLESPNPEIEDLSYFVMSVCYANALPDV
jgi:hypothetical protein